MVAAAVQNIVMICCRCQCMFHEWVFVSQISWFIQFPPKYNKDPKVVIASMFVPVCYVIGKSAVSWLKIVGSYNHRHDVGYARIYPNDS